MHIIDSFKNFLRPKYPSLNRLEILSNNLLANLEFLQSLKPEAEMIPVLKANAYGHGLKEIAKILNQATVERVAVDSFPEAQIVNRYFKAKALIIGEMPLKAYQYLNWKKVEVVVYNLATLKALAKYGQKAKVHLFFNSGMNREGIKDIDDFLVKGQDYLKRVDLIGFCSHLAAAEEAGDLNAQQLEAFFKAHQSLISAGFKPPIVHLGNSAAVFSLKDKRLKAYRVGLSFYGYHIFSNHSPFKELADNHLKPALRVISQVVSVYNLKAGEIVSYNASYQASDACQIITIPFGYYEGLDWSLSNSRFKASLNRQELIEVELIGRVSMNLSNWRVLGNQTVKLGDEVIILSVDKKASNCLANMAKLSSKIVYELLIRFRGNIRRIIK